MAKQPSKQGVKQYKNAYTGKAGSYTPLQPMSTSGDKLAMGKGLGKFKGDRKPKAKSKPAPVKDKQKASPPPRRP